MESLIDVFRWAHVLGACVLIGTGSGIAFFMVMAHRSGDVAHIARTARTVVIADFVFTLPAVVAQPLSGWALAHVRGWSLTEPWIVAALLLYIFIGLLWLPVVFLQSAMHKHARAAHDEGRELGPAYHRLFRIWFLCGIPAFTAILMLLWLMLNHVALGF